MMIQSSVAAAFDLTLWEMLMGSVTQWIDDLQSSGASLAQQDLWNRYFERLVRLAGNTLDGSPQRMADGEDVAIGALQAFFAGARKQRFPELNGRDGLWPLLVAITQRRAINQLKREGAKKRGGGRVRGHVLARSSSGIDFRVFV